MSKSSVRRDKMKKYTKQYLYMFAVTVKWFVILLILGGFLVGGVAFGYATSLVKDEPLRSKDEILSQLTDTEVSGFIYFNDDTLIGQTRSNENRILISLHEIPQTVLDAILSIEDKDFKKHFGVNIRSFARAARQQLLNEPVQTGGSTITQQVTKLSFFSSEKTNERKAKEILLAVRLERYLSKDQILEIYLNKIQFGRGSDGSYLSGIKMAAEGIFGVGNLNDLHVAQAAYLAGLPQSPSEYSAYTVNGTFNERGFNSALDRQRLVLLRMFQEEKLTEQQYEQALAFDIKASLAPTKKKAYTAYPFLMLEAERKAAEALVMMNNPHFTAADLRHSDNADLIQQQRDMLLQGGYRIYTTIDKTIYDAMQEIAQDPDNFLPEHEEKGIEQVGMMMLDNKTSAIIAMMEGRDFYVEQMNHATQAIRQPGSAFKPIAAYLPAIDAGLIQPATAVDDSPIMLPDWTKGYHIPNNVNYRFAGLVTARQALNHSYNIPALKIYNEVLSIDTALDFVKEMGITTIVDDDYHARTGVIGGLRYGTTVEELTNAYTAIANYGQLNDAYMIRKIEDAEGRIIYEHEHAPRRVVSEQSAYLMTDMLSTVISSGTGTSVRRDFEYWGEVPIAGKTGTTQSWHDVWFVGYSPDVTVGVWAGYGEPSSLLTSQGAQHRAKEIWTKAMNKAIELKPELFATEEFRRPEDIVSMTVSSVSGLIPSELIREQGMLVTDIFNRAYLPEREDNVLRSAKVVKYNGLNYIPLATTPDDMTRQELVLHRDPSIFEMLQQLEEAIDGMADNHKPRKSGNVRMSISDFYPADIGRAEPTLADPRVDDGLPPNPPTNITLTMSDSGRLDIKFDWSDSPDVVGYRLYRSSNGGPFAHIIEHNVLVGDEPHMINYVSTSYDHAVYITAVDVAGNESAPSRILSTSSNYDHGGFPTPQNPGFEVPDIDDEHWSDPLFPPGDDEADEDDSEGLDEEQASSSLPAQPQNVSVSHSEHIPFVAITWDANPRRDNINRYHIYYSETEDGDYEPIGSSNTPSFDHLSLGSIYGWYRVVAENNHGTSPPSSPVLFEEP